MNFGETSHAPFNSNDENVTVGRLSMRRHPDLLKNVRAGTRGPKLSISAESICDTALTIIDRDGVQGLTMRRLAAESRTSINTLYKRMGNRDMILRGVEQLWATRFDVGIRSSDSWARAAAPWFIALHDELVSRPHVASLIDGDIFAHFVRGFADLVDLAVTEGMPRVEAVKYNRLMFDITVSDALRAVRSRRPNTRATAVDDSLGTNPSKDFTETIAVVLDGIEYRFVARPTTIGEQKVTAPTSSLPVRTTV